MDIITLSDKIRKILNFLQGENVYVKIIPDLYNILSGQVKMNSILGVPLIEINQEIIPQWQGVLKRILDISVSLSILIIFSWLYLIIALTVKLTSKGPIFYSHKRIGKAAGGSMEPKHHKPKPPRLPRFPDKWKPRPFDFARRPEKSFIEQAGGSEKGKPHSTKEGRIASGKRKIIRALQSYSKPGGKKMGLPSRRKDFRTHGRDVPTMAAKGGRIGFKKGGSDKNWMQKVSASIKQRGTKGKCTPITKPGCTGRAKALARTFKKMGRERKAKG